jgi:hypothetical protein
LKGEIFVIKSRLNQLIIAMGCLAVLSLPLFVAGCGDEGETEDNMDIVNPPVTQPPPVDNTNPPQEEPPKEEPKVSFQKEVFPIFQANCLFAGCHLSNPPSGLLLTTYDNFKKGGNGGPAFVPKNSKGSLIIKRIDGGGMPLGRAPLKKDQIQLIADWIDAGGENN